VTPQVQSQGECRRAAANVGNDRNVLIGERKRLIGAQRTLNEEGNRRRANRLRCIEAIGRKRDIERRHPVRLFAFNAESLAA
jgi:hypothetical protein